MVKAIERDLGRGGIPKRKPSPSSPQNQPKQPGLKPSDRQKLLPALLTASKALLLTILAVSAAVFVAESIHWPLVGDSAQIHYICFLLDHGMAPYRVAQDMNMPGALLLEWLVMHTLGPGSLAWRCFDLLLLAAATGAMAVIAGRTHRLAGVGAGLLLLLLHGADGLNDTGERDLCMAVFLLLAYAALFALLRQLSGRSTTGARLATLAALFGLCSGVAASIKPTALPLVLLLVGALWWKLRTRRVGPATSPGRMAFILVVACAALLLPFAGTLLFLLRQHALGAFVHGLRTAVPYYASLERQGLGYLLLHSVSPLLAVILCWLAAPAWLRLRPPAPESQRTMLQAVTGFLSQVSTERYLLLLAIVFGLLSYMWQGKGFPYYRYPLLAFLLPPIAIDIDRALKTAPARSIHRAWAVRAGFAAVTLLLAAGWLAPVSAWKAHRFRWQDQQFIGSLSRDLVALHAADGEVQCIDSISGCGNTLLRLQLVQSTGLLSDFFLFPGAGPGTAEVPAVREARARFQAAVLPPASSPRYMVITDGLHLHPEDPGRWHKLEQWPWFATWLQQNYTLVLTREPTRLVLWWSRPSMPAAYRLYVRKQDAAAARDVLARASGFPPGSSAALYLPEP